MIRPITLLACLAAAGSGLYLYQTKLSAQLLDQRITRTVDDIRRVRQHTALLTAEYALLNDPQRLQQLSDQFLQLPPTAPGQFVTMADLATRLPPVGPPPTPPQDAAPAAGAPSANAPSANAPSANAPSGGSTPSASAPSASAPVANAPAASVPPSSAPATPAATASVLASARPAVRAVAAQPVHAQPVRTAAAHLPDIRRLLTRAPSTPAPSPVHAQPLPRPVSVAVNTWAARPAVAQARPVSATAVAMPRPSPIRATPAVSMLGMAWTTPGHTVSAPGGNR